MGQRRPSPLPSPREERGEGDPSVGANRPSPRSSRGEGAGRRMRGGVSADKRQFRLTRQWTCASGIVRRDQACAHESRQEEQLCLRLQPSLLEEARKVAETEGVALNQFINVAVAEKLSALRTETYFQERAARAEIGAALGILNRAGKGEPAVEGDEILK
jgi:predicted HicB family RNase H-like nuclease